MMLLFFILSIFLNFPVNARLDIVEYTYQTNGTYFHTYKFPNGTRSRLNVSSPEIHQEKVDCFGLGETVAKGLEWFFLKDEKKSNDLDVNFFLTTRTNPKRFLILVGNQFDLVTTHFKIERRTVFIVHGFLSQSEEQWVKDMGDAFLQWGDVNVVSVDWSAHGNTWNYWRAATNAKTAAREIVKFLSHVINATRETTPDESTWGSIHMVGHSLGAHICGIAARKFKEIPTTWKIDRITGLDPAQPCFQNVPESALNKNDAPFVDVIHTNGNFLSSLGFGLPGHIGHVDFYPNGGQMQPGCVRVEKSLLDRLHIPDAAVRQAICSHGRSYLYFTESIVAASGEKTKKCNFWGHSWDQSYGGALRILNETCNINNCIEMGIDAKKYTQRGTFFVITSSVTPFCEVSEADKLNIAKQLKLDYFR